MKKSSNKNDIFNFVIRRSCSVTLLHANSYMNGKASSIFLLTPGMNFASIKSFNNQVVKSEEQTYLEIFDKIQR